MKTWTWQWLIATGIAAIVGAFTWWLFANDANADDRAIAQFICAIGEDCDVPTVSPVPMILLGSVGALAVLVGVILRGQRVTSPGG